MKSYLLAGVLLISAALGGTALVASRANISIFDFMVGMSVGCAGTFGIMTIVVGIVKSEPESF